MRIARGIAGVLVLMGLAGCGKPVNPNDLPVSHWADPKTIGTAYGDACSVASAQAIVKSGLPFPNYGTRDELAADGKTVKKRITTVDYWMGGTRFVFPAELAHDGGGYPQHNPNRYRGLHGTLPHFYPKGAPAPVKDGMGAMVDVRFVCSMEANFVASWGKGYQAIEDGVQKVKAEYERRLSMDPANPGTVMVSIREDLGMREVLLDRAKEAYGQRAWEATYWPLTSELKSLSGNVSSIGCQIRHDPIQKRYGGRGWRCTSSMRITPNVFAAIDIYVSHIEQMPSIYEQVKQVIINAKKAGE